MSILLVAGGLIGAVTTWKVLEVAYRFYDVRNQLAHVLRSADIEPDLELRKKAFAVAKRAGVTCAEQDIVILRSVGQVKIELPYRHEIGMVVSGKQLQLLSLPLKASAEHVLSD